jgi:hypothetical protein
VGVDDVEEPVGPRGCLSGRRKLRILAADEAALTVLDSCRRGVLARHGLHFFEALVMLAEGNPWVPDAA